MAKQQRTTEADAPIAGAYAPSCRANGDVVARRLSPDEFSIWLYVSDFGAGASLEWGTEHGDEAVYVLEGTLEIQGTLELDGQSRACPAGGAVLVESGVAAKATAPGPAKIAHFGSRGAEVTSDKARRGKVVHVVGPRGRYESPPGQPFFRFFADSTCETCDAFLLFSQRDHGWSVTPHSHSADEVIYIIRGGVRTGGVVNHAGATLAFPANVKYALAAEATGFESINFRSRRSELKFVGDDGTIEETAANVGGIAVGGSVKP